MLKIIVPGEEGFDETTNKFLKLSKDVELKLEHSLVSLSKWESKWKKPFIGRDDRTTEETIDYIKCMTITQNVDDSVYDRLSVKNIKQVIDYINDPMTATTITSSDRQQEETKVITSERIYCWMFSLGIPMECQKWHLNRLIMLIRVCSIEMNPNKKTMSKNEIYSQNKRLNELRRKAMRSKG